MCASTAPPTMVATSGRGWVTFLSSCRLESALFSLKAYGPTAKRAAELLKADNDLFVDADIAAANEPPAIAVALGSKMANKRAENEEAFSAWAAQKEKARKEKLKARKAARRKAKQKKTAQKQKSAAAVKKWKRGIKKGKYYSVAKGAYAER